MSTARKTDPSGAATTVAEESARNNKDLDYLFDPKEKERFRLMELEANVRQIYTKYEVAQPKSTTSDSNHPHVESSKRMLLESLGKPKLLMNDRGSAFSQKMENTLTFNRNDMSFLNETPQ